MKFLRNLQKNAFLFLLIWVPLCVYGKDISSTLDTGRVDSEIRATERNLSKKDDLVGLARSSKKHKKLKYYLYTADFIGSFIEIPTSNVSGDSSTISSRYLAGRAPLYDSKNRKVGICSASFLCMQNQENIFTDIANYISVDNGLIVTWFTPSTLINLELDSIVHSMVTECIVTASTKVGFNPFYGKKFNMVVSSDQTKIYFKLTRIR